MQQKHEPEMVVSPAEPGLANSETAPVACGRTTLDGTALDLNRLLGALQAMRTGDFSIRLPGDQVGLAGKVADTFNEIVAANQRMAQQLENVGQVVGRDGKTRTRVKFGLSHGAWGDMESSVNTLIDDLLWPTTAVTRTITAVAKGDLLQPMPLDVDGRPLVPPPPVELDPLVPHRPSLARGHTGPGGISPGHGRCHRR